MQTSRSFRGKVWDFLSNGLWTEALRLFFYYWRSWIKGVAGFSLVFVAITYCSQQAPDPFLWHAVALVAHLCLIYFFMVCFLYQEPLTAVVNPSPRQFFRFFLSLGLIAVVLIGMRFIVDHVLNVWTAMYPIPVGDDLVLMSKGLIRIIDIWIFFRLLFVGPLAASNVPVAFKKSWDLTRGNLFRLCGNWVMLGLMFLPLFLVDKEQVLVLDNVVDVIITGIYSAFICVSCRILNGEYIAAQLGQDRRTVSRS